MTQVLNTQKKGSERDATARDQWKRYSESFHKYNKKSKYIKEPDWVLLNRIIDEHNIHTILEFGSGLSTLLFASKGCLVTSYETNEQYLETVKKWILEEGFQKNIEYKTWDNKIIPDLNRSFDACLVDGEMNRLNQLLIAMKCGKYLFLHDNSQWQHEKFRFLKELPELGTTNLLKVRLNETVGSGSRLH